MSKYTSTPVAARLAGPRAMRKHATDAMLGKTVTARGKQQPWHRFAETVTGQVWCAAELSMNGRGCYWIATDQGFYVAHESSFAELADRTQDVALFAEEVAS